MEELHITSQVPKINQYNNQRSQRGKLRLKFLGSVRLPPQLQNPGYTP